MEGNMRLAVPLYGNRVAPRSAYAESLLVVTIHGDHVVSRRIEKVRIDGGLSLVGTINDLRIGVLVCGGISRSLREELRSNGVEVLQNITGTIDDVLDQITSGKLLADYPGIKAASDGPMQKGQVTAKPIASKLPLEDLGIPEPQRFESIDCISCRDRVCLRGENCLAVEDRVEAGEREFIAMIDSALDISAENERQLCRLSELVYY
ncbi:MAG TPA: hypothetical protein ENL08_01075, partial [Bacteroidetes bacterium]|nr:hypothetical protein [Bacteroidota bacterium]